MFTIAKSSRLHVLAVSVLAATTGFAAPAADSGPRDSNASSTAAAGKLQPRASYGQLPLSFEANQGQVDSLVKFVARGKGYSLFLTNSAAVLALTKGQTSSQIEICPPQRSQGSPSHSRRSAGYCSASTDTIQMQLAGSNPNARVAGDSQLPGIANYFLGNDPAKWHSNIPTYAKVRYSQIYEGIDLVYYGNQGQLEYDFVVAPNADPKPIQLQFAGAKSLTLTRDGNLQVSGQNGQIAFHKPILYQESNGHRQPVEGRFTLLADNTVRFKIGRYDHAKSLVIDPVLTYSTYLGGSNGGDHGDAAWAIAVDSTGSAYIAGQAYSSNFPVTANAYETKDGAAAIGVSNAFVTKLNPAGTALTYSTYFGGTSDNVNDIAFGIAVDAEGDAYVVGQATSTDFPTTKGAYQSAIKARENAFVAKFNPGGSALLYSTCLGGTYSDVANAVAVDASGDAYVTGQTLSTDFPVTKGALQAVNHHPYGGNEFVTKFNPEGSALIYSTYLGGSNGYLGDSGAAIAVDTSGEAYVVGGSQDTDFPTTVNPYQGAMVGQQNAVISKLNPAGSQLIYSTYIGGSGADSAAGVVVDSSGNAHIAGQTTSQNYPVTEGVFQPNFGYTTDGGSNAFVTKFNSTGTALVYSSYLGGNGEGDTGNAIALDKLGDAYITGETAATNFPLTPGAFQTTNKAYRSSAFLTKVNPTGTELLYSTYLGGSGSQGNGGDSGNAIALNPTTGDAFVAGRAYSANFPTTPGAFQTTNRGAAQGSSNAFVASLAIGGETTTTLTSSLNPEPQGGSVTFTAKVIPTYDTTTPTGSVVFTIDGKTAATVALSAGQAAYSTSALALGKHTVIAAYGGNTTGYLASTAPTLTQNISIATPVLSPAAGAYPTPQTVTITDATPGAIIFYTSTTNGATPTGSSTKYTGPITVGASSVIEAIAAVSGYAASAVAKADYTILEPPPSPTITPVTKTYTSAQLVTITNSSQAPTATIYYTTNGTTPTTTSAKYTGPFLVSASEIVSAIAVLPDKATSKTTAAVYTIVDWPTGLGGPATAITTSSATLNAFTSTQGLAGTYYFQYGSSATTLTSTTTKTALTTQPTVQVSAPLTGLKTKTTYYYQFVVTTAAGSALSPVLNFTTN